MTGWLNSSPWSNSQAGTSWTDSGNNKNVAVWSNSPWSNTAPAWGNAWNDTGVGTWRDSPTWKDAVIWTNAPWSNQAPDVTSPTWKNTGTTTPTLPVWSNAPGVVPIPAWMDTSVPVVTPPIVVTPIQAPVTPIGSNPFLDPFNAGWKGALPTIPSISPTAPYQPGKMQPIPLGTTYKTWSDSAPRISTPSYQEPIQMGIGGDLINKVGNIFSGVTKKVVDVLPPSLTNLFGGTPINKVYEPIDMTGYPSMSSISGIKAPNLLGYARQQTPDQVASIFGRSSQQAPMIFSSESVKQRAIETASKAEGGIPSYWSIPTPQEVSREKASNAMFGNIRNAGIPTSITNPFASKTPAEPQYYFVDYGKTRTKYIYDPNKPFIESVFGTEQKIEPGMSYRKDIFGSITRGVPIENAMASIKVAPETARTMQTIFDVGQVLNPIAMGGVASPLAGFGKLNMGKNIISPFGSTLSRSGGIEITKTVSFGKSQGVMFEGTPQYVVPKPEANVPGLVKAGGRDVVQEISQLFATPSKEGMSTPFLRTTARDTGEILKNFNVGKGDFIKTPYGSYQRFEITGKNLAPSVKPQLHGQIEQPSMFGNLKKLIGENVRIETKVDMSPARLTNEPVIPRQQLNAINWDVEADIFKQKFQGFPSAKPPKTPTYGMGYTPKSELGGNVFTEISGRTAKSPSFMPYEQTQTYETAKMQTDLQAFLNVRSGKYDIPSGGMGAGAGSFGSKGIKSPFEQVFGVETPARGLKGSPAGGVKSRIGITPELQTQTQAMPKLKPKIQVMERTTTVLPGLSDLNKLNKNQYPESKVERSPAMDLWGEGNYNPAWDLTKPTKGSMAETPASKLWGEGNYNPAWDIGRGITTKPDVGIGRRVGINPFPDTVIGIEPSPYPQPKEQPYRPPRPVPVDYPGINVSPDPFPIPNPFFRPLPKPYPQPVPSGEPQPIPYPNPQPQPKPQPDTNTKPTWMDSPPPPPFIPDFPKYTPKPRKDIMPPFGGPGGDSGRGKGVSFFRVNKEHPIEENILGKQVQEAPRRKAPQMMHNVQLPFSGGQAQAGRVKQPKPQRNMMPSMGKEVQNSMFGKQKRGKKGMMF